MTTANRRYVLATGNTGKLREVNALLSALDIDLVPQSDFSVPEAEETGLTFVENAILKARNASRHTGLPAIADDSGLEVDELRGAPGIHSARFAGPDADDTENLELLLEQLRDVPMAKRAARFRCVIVVLGHSKDPMPVICHGTWNGVIAERPAGVNGFGYDPVFVPEGHACTSAELAKDEKNKLSHRGQALAKLVRALESSDSN